MTQTNPTFEVSLMREICHYIEANLDKRLTLAELSKQAHLSPPHFQRRFKAVIGVSPKEYIASCRIKKFKNSLKNNNSVTDAIYDGGFGSSSRVYSKIDSKLGMTPRQYKEQGRRITISYGFGETPYGTVLIAATDRGICFIQFRESQETLLENLQAEFKNAALVPMRKESKEQFALWIKALCAYLKGKPGSLDLPLDIKGTAFQIKVWKYLQKIPYGKVESYAEVAKGIGNKKAYRAVANACANNKIAIVIPCHRVIRGNGELAGFRWGGVEVKKKLLELENSELS